jgi:hypothetical protein
MNDVLQEIGQGLSALGSNWTRYSVVGSFLLYLSGYLAIRFHLTAFGIGTDLAVLDERYVFAGARFLVYLVATIPSILLVGLPVAGITWGVARAASWRVASLRRWWFTHPLVVTWTAVVVAILVIQLAMRQSFFLSNLLLAEDLTRYPSWLVALLRDDGSAQLYFGGLVIACALSLTVLIGLRDVESRHASAGMRSAKGLLAFLASVQILFLPINFGIFMMDKTLPRVPAVGTRPVADRENAWLVWEGKDGSTFLLRRQNGTRVLQTIPHEEAKHVEILQYDAIIPKLFPQP